MRGMRGALYLESTLKGLRANSAAALRRWASISVRWYGQVRTAAVCCRRNLSPLNHGVRAMERAEGVSRGRTFTDTGDWGGGWRWRFGWLVPDLLNRCRRPAVG